MSEALLQDWLREDAGRTTKKTPISTLRLEAGKAETRIDCLYALIDPSLQILLLVRQQSVAYNMRMGVSTRPARAQETHR